MKTLGIIGATLGLTILGGFSALGIQALFTKNTSNLNEPIATHTVAPIPQAAPAIVAIEQSAPAPSLTAISTSAPTPAIIESAPEPITPIFAAPQQLAQILNVKPHYETVKKPVRECYQTKQVYYMKPQPNAPGAGAVLGGIAGGLAGTAVHGKNHTAAVIAGAALGAVGGNAMQNNMNQPAPRYVYSKQCDTHYVSTRVKKGYEVTYLYNGQQGILLMENKPIGNTMPAPY